MAKTKRFVNLRNPNYRGLWVSEESNFGLFYIWLREKTLEGISGKCWEKYQGPLIESTIHNLKQEKSEIFFIKEYKNPTADLQRGPVSYKGTREDDSDLFRGFWQGANIDGNKITGHLYLTDNPKNIEDFKKKLANLHLNLLERKLENIQI